MDITTDGDWGPNWLHIAFGDKNLLGLFAKSLDAVFWKGLAIQEFINLLIEVLDV